MLKRKENVLLLNLELPCNKQQTLTQKLKSFFSRQDKKKQKKNETEMWFLPFNKFLKKGNVK